MNNKKSYASGVNIGSSSILVTFVLLCLVTFAALSFVSANADNRLAQQTAERTTDYYTANNTAEEYLSEINELLRDHFKQTENSSDFYSGISDLISVSGLSNLSISVIENAEDDILLTYSVPVNKNQILNITLKVVYPESANDEMFEIMEWDTISEYTEDEIPGSEESGFLF